MVSDLINYLDDKKINILGFGREGQSTYKLIRKYLPTKNLVISDLKENFQDNFDILKNDDNVEFISGEKYLDNLETFDIIIKSPGISFAKIDISKFKHKISSQMELFMQFFNNYTIGITGTKGKSTTSSLIYTILKEQDKDCLLLGNIGKPIFEYIDEIDQNTILVLEISAHQLEFMTYSPNIAILLNIFEEHLDHYKSYEDYIEAKCNIYKYQKKSDYFLYSLDNEELRRHIYNSKAITYTVSLVNNKDNKMSNFEDSKLDNVKDLKQLNAVKAKLSTKKDERTTELLEKNITDKADIRLEGDYVYFNKKKLYNRNEKRNLVGDYNLSNIMFALGVSEILKLDLNKSIKSIDNFKTLKHRLEYVGNFDGVDFYDNSIATVPMSTIEAVKALRNVDTLIIGGMDRGIDYSEFVKYLNNSDISNIICMPKTGHDIAKKLKIKKAYVVETLEEAVSVAKKVTCKGKSCLLSPAAASYGFFKNFEEKGDMFQKLVRQK